VQTHSLRILNGHVTSWQAQAIFRQIEK